jgi:hypothetical protein
MDMRPPEEVGVIAFNLYGDVRFGGSTGPDQVGFALGQLDFFVQGALAKHLSFLAETVAEVNETNEWKVEVERYQINYNVNDHLELRLGRVHALYGYYNAAYHHGEWMATQILRPRVVAFEDDGGLLPVHLVGLEAAGRFALRKVTLGYGVDVANGRGPLADEVSSFGDSNLFKAVNLLAYAAFPSVGLRFGGNFSFDRAPPVTAAEEGMLYPLRNQSIDERIFGAHLVWERDPYQLLAEYYQIRHTPTDMPTATNHGYFVIASYGIGELRPYVEWSGVRFDKSVVDLYYSPTGVPLDNVDLVAGGLKYWLGDMLAIKLEYAHEWRSILPDRHIGAMQVAFGL